ncbi:hypothetical protein QBC33DRAFT_556607 [Phialemonium atrogriseum]|uniref:Uncharacterized protein n=1 Tax=Phialemonium atrogriseum TaxID=1093897 RepID=A0AAJ0FJ23_9PEZI|nr:uncharacterized protein QBC33DRAFT_556607 [Phialemonium atrogriseum]KAK1770186.1 hypothetical protein QBC33DRAFT_556607 [Phialemonium atrogriseum]
MDSPKETREQPWKKWYKPIDKAATDFAMAVLPVFLAGNGNNGTDHLDFAVYTAGSTAAAATAEVVNKRST